MHKWKNVAIVGVGMIGGSIGLALRKRGLVERVIGVGRNPESLQRALRRGAVTEITSRVEDLDDSLDLAVVCTPVATIADFVLRFARQFSRPVVITDAGSTKGDILQAVERNWPGGPVQFVGSHPLAGSEKTGPDYADAELLVGRKVIVTPGNTARAEVVADLNAWWQLLGAEVHTMSADAHDRAVAWISHLPHVVASLLAAGTPADCLPWVASGWRDTTRVAAGDVGLWSQIVATNRGHLLAALDAFQGHIQDFRIALSEDHPAGWERLLTEGKERRDAVAD